MSSSADRLAEAIEANTRQLRPPLSFVRGAVMALGGLFASGVLAGIVGGILRAVGLI